MLMTSSLLYENPTYMTSFNMSTVFTPKQSLPWKLNRIPNSHSWTHSSRGIVTTPSPSESTHTDQYLKFTSHHLARAKKSIITSLFTGQRTSLPTLPTKKKKKIISQQYFKLMVTQRNSLATQLEHHSHQDN